MERRHVLIAAAGTLLVPRAFAHHGWSSFDQGRPVYLEGVARKVVWRNPHVEFDLEVPAEIKVPAELAKRPVPAQSATGPRCSHAPRRRAARTRSGTSSARR
jgi:hypothetical protein